MTEDLAQKRGIPKLTDLVSHSESTKQSVFICLQALNEAEAPPMNGLGSTFLSMKALPCLIDQRLQNPSSLQG